MEYIKLNAVDSLFFRDGKPFTMGDDNVGVSLFPPPPSVLRGMVRTLHFADLGGDVTLANTATDPTANATIDFFALDNDHGELLYPMPADLSVVKVQAGQPYQPEWLFQGVPTGTMSASSYSMPLLLHTDPAKPNIKLEDPFGKVYLTSAEMHKYMKGQKPDHAVNVRDWLTTEPKVGIGRCNFSRTANDTGLLYQIQMQRPESVKKGKLGMIIGYNGLNIRENYPFVRLGGEGKLAEYVTLNPQQIPTLTKPQLTQFARVKMYLSTPALFEEGWQPAALFRDHDIEIEACVIGRYQSYGGWDIKARGPKPMFKGVPAGSVYYLKSNDIQKLQAFIDTFHGQRLIHPASIPDAYAKDGFGIVWFATMQ
jgi:CRISPR-associated protein Cmr3